MSFVEGLAIADLLDPGLDQQQAQGTLPQPPQTPDSPARSDSSRSGLSHFLVKHEELATACLGPAGDRLPKMRLIARPQKRPKWAVSPQLPARIDHAFRRGRPSEHRRQSHGVRGITSRQPAKASTMSFWASQKSPC